MTIQTTTHEAESRRKGRSALLLGLGLGVYNVAEDSRPDWQPLSN